MAVYSLARSGNRYRLVSTWWHPSCPGSRIVATFADGALANLVADALTQWSADLWVAATGRPQPDYDPMSWAERTMRKWFGEEPPGPLADAPDLVGYRQRTALLAPAVRLSVLEEAGLELAAAEETNRYLVAEGPVPLDERSMQYCDLAMATRVGPEWMWGETTSLEFSFLARVDPAFHPAALRLVEAVTPALRRLAPSEGGVAAFQTGWLVVVITSPLCHVRLWSGSVPHVTFSDPGSDAEGVSLFDVPAGTVLASRGEAEALAPSLATDGFLDDLRLVPAEAVMPWMVPTNRSAAVRALLDRHVRCRTPTHLPYDRMVATVAAAVVHGAVCCAEGWGHDDLHDYLLDGALADFLYRLRRSVDNLFVLVSDAGDDADWEGMSAVLAPAAIRCFEWARQHYGEAMGERATALFIETGIGCFSVLVEGACIRDALRQAVLEAD